MSTETSRKVVGTTGKGEVAIITKQDNAGVDESSTVQTSESYIVREGAHTVLETTSEARAQTVAKALVGDSNEQSAPRGRTARQAADVAEERVSP